MVTVARGPQDVELSLTDVAQRSQHVRERLPRRRSLTATLDSLLRGPGAFMA